MADARTGALVASVVCLVISSIAVSLRCYARLVVVRQFGWDDALMLIAMALGIFYGAVCIHGSLNGFGMKNQEFKSAADLQKALFIYWLGTTPWLWTGLFARISISASLLRIAVARTHVRILYGVIVLATVTGVAFWFLLLLECTPVQGAWNRTSNVRCVSDSALLGASYAYVISTAACDFTLGIVPVFFIWKLQMGRRSRIALIVILSMGSAAGISVLVRIPFLPTLTNGEDFLYYICNIIICANVEDCLGITAGSLPAIRPLFIRWGISGFSSGAGACSSMGLGMHTHTPTGLVELSRFPDHQGIGQRSIPGLSTTQRPTNSFHNSDGNGSLSTETGGRWTSIRENNSEESLNPHPLAPSVKAQDKWKA